jgi:hypothetical protein
MTDHDAEVSYGGDYEKVEIACWSKKFFMV